jgi:hypothetical protein
MGASVIPAASTTASDNWVQISSVTPTASAATLTFSSIGTYKKLMLRLNNPGLSGSGSVTVTFNGDTGTKYSLYGVPFASSGVSAIADQSTAGLIFGTTVNAISGAIIIEQADTSNLKNVSGYARVQTPSPVVIFSYLAGAYLASAAISSITITLTGTFAATGTVALYGVA